MKLCCFTDIVFIALHGADGENGKIQATFNLFIIKYTGSNYIASALAMDKNLSKQSMRQNNITTPTSYVVSRSQCNNSKRITHFPLVIKSMRGDSSISVSIVKTLKNMRKQ